MAQKTVKIGGNRIIKTLSVEIGEGTYSVPLAGSMRRKDLSKLTDEQSIYDMFAKHIPAKVLDELTMDEYKELADAWNAANEEANGEKLGES